MTRVNADLDPRTLTRRHLVAELREITMVPAALRRSLRTQSVGTVLAKIPKCFTLGKGHVTFFYDKQSFLKRRFNKLASEMERRGYVPDRSRIRAFYGFDKIWRNNWKSDSASTRIITYRIRTKIRQKPHLY
jgi:deoxyribonuclease (pyrimidine dimer)